MSDCNEEPFCPSSSGVLGTTGTGASRSNDTVNNAKPASAMSLARVCGPSRSKCGYCSGKRINLLELNDGHNKVLQVSKGDHSVENKTNNGDTQYTKGIDKIDTTKTAKSYGLLFDSLNYNDYEALVNKGWRRSGKHLYRPHNFESCCPSLSIRLETSKFQSDSIYQKSTSADDSANSVLVGGSKSQRRVGRNLLRALNAYNSKCISSEDDSVNAFNLADIQLDSNEEKEGTKTLDEQHPLKKKSRRYSPSRGDQNMRKTFERREFDRASLQEFEKSERLFLSKMARFMYKELTNIVIAYVIELASNSENPKWAWWNGGVSETPKWCSFKFISRGDSIIASTSACAAAAGRTRAAIDKLRLALAVTDRLKDYANAYMQSNPTSSGIRQVTEVTVHERSGHVHMILDICDGALVTTSVDNVAKTSLPKSIHKTDVNANPIEEMIFRDRKVHQQFNRTEINSSEKRIRRFLTVRSVPVCESAQQPEVHRLFCLYQSKTHGDFNPFAEYDEANFRDEVHEYNYYKQQNVPGFLDVDVAYKHLDEDSRDRIKTSYIIFFKFLCETPVPQAPIESTPFIPSIKDGYDIDIPFGTYHQHYRLSTSRDGFDGPLVAVGVVDVLPHFLSSVYAFYDPTFSSRLELGKYTALREIEWVRRASKYRTELKYYYLGKSGVCLL